MANTWKSRYGGLLASDPDNKGLMWHERLELASGEIKRSEQEVVYDFGSGECRLSELIGDKKYVALDTENFSIYEDIKVIEIDLIEAFPEAIDPNSIAVCLGFIDHIMYQDGFEAFMKNLDKNFQKVIFSCQNSLGDSVLKCFSKYFENIELLGKTLQFPPEQSVYVGTK